MEKQYMTHEDVNKLLRDGMDIKNWVSKDAPLWHSRVKSMWRGMWRRCYDPMSGNYKYYVESLICDDFRIFSNFSKWIQAQPRFEEFCNTCHEEHWTIDKDMKKDGNKNYYPEYMTLCTQSDNSKARIEAKGAAMLNPQYSSKLKKPVIGISINDNTILLFKSAKDASNYLECYSGPITSCCKGNKPSYMKYKWYYLDIKDRGDE